jgi:hypothetical protein
MSNHDGEIGFFVGLFLGFVLFAGFLNSVGFESHSSLIKDGYGEYYLDEDHDKQFRMIDKVGK